MSDSRLYHRVANEIIELIDSGAFPPGSRLPAERDLAEKFGVSRVSVREAAIALQAQGRIEIKSGSGSYVQDGSKLVGRGMPKAGPFELTEARALFEAEAAALAAPMMTDEILEELEGYIQAMADENNEAGLTHAEADERFHLTIAQATNNSAIIFTIENLWRMRADAAKLQTVYKAVCDNGAESREKEHREIFDALKDRDGEAARIAMRAHFTRMIEELLRESEEQAYREIRQRTSESRSRYLMSAK